MHPLDQDWIDHHADVAERRLMRKGPPMTREEAEKVLAEYRDLLRAAFQSDRLDEHAK